MLRYWYISNRYIKTHHNHPYRHNYNHLSLIPIESYKQYKLKKKCFTLDVSDAVRRSGPASSQPRRAPGNLKPR